jgi:hypothetical protein
MSRSRVIAVVGICAIGICVILSTVHQSVSVISIPTTTEFYDLTESEKNELKSLVEEKRDAEAAFQLGKHFIFSKHDDGQGKLWMKRASDLGHAGAQSYLDEAEASKNKTKR